MQIMSETQRYESQKFHYQVVDYAFLIQKIYNFIKTHLVLSELQPIKVWLKYVGPELTLGKVGFF